MPQITAGELREKIGDRRDAIADRVLLRIATNADSDYVDFSPEELQGVSQLLDLKIEHSDGIVELPVGELRHRLAGRTDKHAREMLYGVRRFPDHQAVNVLARLLKDPRETATAPAGPPSEAAPPAPAAEDPQPAEPPAADPAADQSGSGGRRRR
jgi:hypothetical protein